jgi:DNA-binding response OmpR family regulator
LTKKILVIDDDPATGKLIEAILHLPDYAVYHAYSGEEGLRQAYQIQPNLIILDITMPGLDGFDVCTRLREFSTVPIMMLTARIHEKDVLRGFQAGVDDFVKKPFHRNEFEARARALLRRSNDVPDSGAAYTNAYTDHILDVDLSSRTVKLSGNIVELSPKEYDLLAYLVREQGKVVSHRTLVQEAWGEHYFNDPAELSLYIYYLRQKLKDGQHGHQYFRTLWGRGYLFAPRSEDAA